MNSTPVTVNRRPTEAGRTIDDASATFISLDISYPFGCNVPPLSRLQKPGSQQTVVHATNTRMRTHLNQSKRPSFLKVLRIGCWSFLGLLAVIILLSYLTDPDSANPRHPQPPAAIRNPLFGQAILTAALDLRPESNHESPSRFLTARNLDTRPVRKDFVIGGHQL